VHDRGPGDLDADLERVGGSGSDRRDRTPDHLRRAPDREHAQATQARLAHAAVEPAAGFDALCGPVRLGGEPAERSREVAAPDLGAVRHERLGHVGLRGGMRQVSRRK
jgi:hypothetical protein